MDGFLEILAGGGGGGGEGGEGVEGFGNPGGCKGLTEPEIQVYREG